MHEIHLGCEYINAGRGTWAPNEKSSGTGLGLEAHARNSRPPHLEFSSPGSARMKLTVDSPLDRLLLDFESRSPFTDKAGKIERVVSLAGCSVDVCTLLELGEW